MKLTVIEEYEAKSSNEADVVIAEDVDGHLYARKGDETTPFVQISEYTLKRRGREVTGIEFAYWIDIQGDSNSTV